MKYLITCCLFVCSTAVWVAPVAAKASETVEEVYVQTPFDTDHDGELDRIYVKIIRQQSPKKLSVILNMTPYDSYNDVNNHDVDLDQLPQNNSFVQFLKGAFNGLKKGAPQLYDAFPSSETKYAHLYAHSIGTGNSTGCPTVGDYTEALAGKAVIDWLNGRAKAFNKNNLEVNAHWANGKVGMTGVSYEGTLPIMVAATGVKELKAIVPIAAISNWYDYYRANGLVVNPGGYVGEDADVLGTFIIRKDACISTVQNISKSMGRETGDFTKFWQDRDYISRVKNIHAATFIIHGQTDWNVKQKHAIQLWEALDSGAPKRMFLHKGAHGSSSAYGADKKISDWFDHFLEDEENGITNGPQVEVELADGALIQQRKWPNESAQLKRYYFNASGALAKTSVSTDASLQIIDQGRVEKIEEQVQRPDISLPGRLIFLSEPFAQGALLSGTPVVNLNFSVMNRRAANLTVALVEYRQNGSAVVITRGWADPQNYQNIAQGELLAPGQNYQIKFSLEPKQVRLKAGSKLGVLLGSTDYNYTIRPSPGTIIQFNLGAKSFIDLSLAHVN